MHLCESLPFGLTSKASQRHPRTATHRADSWWALHKAGLHRAPVLKAHQSLLALNVQGDQHEHGPERHACAADAEHKTCRPQQHFRQSQAHQAGNAGSRKLCDTGACFAALCAYLLSSLSWQRHLARSAISALSVAQCQMISFECCTKGWLQTHPSVS